MPQIKFENGVVVNVEGNPTQADIDEIAQKVGVQNKNPERTQGVFDALKKGAQNIKEGIKESGQELTDTGALSSFGGEKKDVSPFVQAAKVATTGIKGVINPLAEAAIATPMRVGGELIENATGYDINEAAAQGTKKLVEKGLQTETAQKVMNGWKTLQEKDPESAMALSTLLDIGDIASNVVGLGAEKKAITATGEKALKTAIKAGETAEKVGQKATSFTERVANLGKKVTGEGEQATKRGVDELAGMFGKKSVTPDEAKNTFKKNLLEQIQGKKSSLQKLDKTQSDIIDTISSDTRYHPEIDVENKSFNTTKAVQNLTQDRQNYANQLSDLFTNVDEQVGGYDTQSIIDNVASQVLNERNTAKLAVLGGKDSAFVKDTRNLLKNLGETYGDKVPRNEIWKVRQSIDKGINAMSDNQLAKSLRQDVRRAFAKSLENSLPGDNKQIVKRTMEEMQKIIEAGDYMEKTLQGFKIQGGRLTDLIRNQTASQTGAIAGGFAGNILGGPAGALGGYVASKKIGEWLAKNTLLNASEKKAIQSLVKETPEVFDDMKKYIESLGKEKPKSLREGIERLGK